MSHDRKRIGPVVVVALLVMMVPAVAVAQMFVPMGRATLRELPGLEIEVEADQALEAAGVTAGMLRATVAERLRAGGVPVYPSQQANPGATRPFVYVLVTPLALPAGGHAVALQVQVRQALRSPVTASEVVDAVTWGRQSLVFVPPGPLTALLPEVEAMVSGLVADWQAVH